MELHQVQNNHDVLILAFAHQSTRWNDSIETGVPIQVSWSQGTDTRIWYGYVSHMSQDVNAQKIQEMKVTCIGTTFALKERATRVFTHSTIPDAVKTIVTEHGFNFIGDTNSLVFPQLTLAGHSYWEWIQEQAKRIGFAVVVDNMDFYFREMDSFIDQNISSIPVLDIGQTAIPYGVMYQDRTLDGITVLKGERLENTDHVRNTKTVGGVDPITMLPFQAQTSPSNLGNDLRTNIGDALFNEYRSDQVVNSEVHSLEISRGASKMARFTLPAKAKAQGDIRFRPFRPVFISGTGRQSDGYWLIQGVRHYLNSIGDYTADLTLLTDGTGTNSQTSLRQSLPAKINTINVQETLARAKNLGSVSGKTTPKLIQRSPMYTEIRQGFNRTPAMWSV
jgi:phage protein D